MLVFPFLLLFCKSFALARWRRGVSDLGDEVCSGSFCDSVDQDAKQRDSQEDVETNTEAKKQSFSVVKPLLFLRFRESDAREVWLKLRIVSR
jgi:hypothetical protein